jgi:hypothetical protein
MKVKKTRNTVKALFMVARAKWIFRQTYAMLLTLNSPDFILLQILSAFLTCLEAVPLFTLRSS